MTFPRPLGYEEFVGLWLLAERSELKDMMAHYGAICLSQDDSDEIRREYVDAVTPLALMTAEAHFRWLIARQQANLRRRGPRPGMEQ